MLVKAALGEKAAGEDRQNRNADHAERQKQALQSPGHQTGDGQKDQERQNSSCASAAEGPFAPVEASVEMLDQRPDPGDGMPDPRVKAIRRADGRLRRESEEQDQRAVGEGHGTIDGEIG